MFRFALITVLVNRDPIDCLTVIVRPVGVSLVMLHVNAFVEDLAKADRDRLKDTEQAIEPRRTEVRIVNEVVGNTVDVPGNADRIDKTENEHDPKRDARKKKKHAEEVGAVEKGCGNGDRVPPRVRKDSGVRCGALDNYEFA